jgi:hypothetical protein
MWTLLPSPPRGRSPNRPHPALSQRERGKPSRQEVVSIGVREKHDNRWLWTVAFAESLQLSLERSHRTVIFPFVDERK